MIPAFEPSREGFGAIRQRLGFAGHGQRDADDQGVWLPFADELCDRVPVGFLLTHGNRGQGRGRAGQGLADGDTDTLVTEIKAEQSGMP